MITFEVPGRPCAKQSVRFTKAGRRYQPADVLAYHDKIGWYARQAYAGMLDGPVAISIVARFLTPRSWSKKRRANPGCYAQRPDVDNLVKAALDGLKGVLIRDDAQVCILCITKLWSDDVEGLTIQIEPLSYSGRQVADKNGREAHPYA